MSTVAWVISILGGLLTITLGVFAVSLLIRAGTGNFLKARNQELATALAQEIQLRENDSKNHTAELQRLRDQQNELRGQVRTLTTQFAEIIAVKVVEYLEEQGWTRTTR